MLGSDEKVGVWMVVMVEQETVTGNLTRPSEVINNFPSPPPNVMGRSSLETPVRGGEGARSPRFKAETGKLYAEYLRREGKATPHEGYTEETTGSPREARPFQDFWVPVERNGRVCFEGLWNDQRAFCSSRLASRTERGGTKLSLPERRIVTVKYKIFILQWPMASLILCFEPYLPLKLTFNVFITHQNWALFRIQRRIKRRRREDKEKAKGMESNRK
jgi:hypothetical protein